MCNVPMILTRGRMNYYGNTLSKEYAESYVRERIIADNMRQRNLTFLWEGNIAGNRGYIIIEE